MMRLNLGEIAMSLGCGPGMVIWDGPAADSPHAQAVQGAPSSLKDLARRRSRDGGSARTNAVAGGAVNHWGHTPWAGLTPSGAHIDSRKVMPGNLFFCLPGERTDGHDFAVNAARAGASAIIASRNPFGGGANGRNGGGRDSLVYPPVFLVEDVQRTLARVAMCHRDTSLARVIGITGTAGKTSVKEALARVLEVHGRTERNHMNLNNQIGLPLSMLNASADASFWVMEMGISEAGDMEDLGQMLRPDLGLILNVGDGHVSGLGDEGVAAHKARLIDYIQPGGIAVISADYAELNIQVERRMNLLARRGVEILLFSRSSPDVFARALYAGPGPCGGRYDVWAKDLHFELDTPFRGEFGSENVAAVAAVALKMGLPPERIAEGFAMVKLPEQRFCSFRYPHFTILDDSYNANPLSASRMLEAARSMADEYDQSLVLVMGEMRELGSKARGAHETLGGQMAGVGPEIVFWKGGHAKAVKKGLETGGYCGPFYPLCSVPEFALLLEEYEINDTLVLFKGSRGNKLEQYVDLFREKATPAGEN